VEEQLVAAIYDHISKYKVDIYEIVIFISKSPCFHQDCDPKCEVVDECRCNKGEKIHNKLKYNFHIHKY
jgi:hypothetical protein